MKRVVMILTMAAATASASTQPQQPPASCVDLFAVQRMCAVAGINASGIIRSEERVITSAHQYGSRTDANDKWDMLKAFQSQYGKDRADLMCKREVIRFYSSKYSDESAARFEQAQKIKPNDARAKDETACLMSIDHLRSAYPNKRSPQ